MAQTIDVSGLSTEDVRTVENLVGVLRFKITTPKPPEFETSEEWVQRLRVWIDSHPKRAIEIDDDRDTIYAGRGE